MKINLLNILHILIIWQSLLFAVVLITPKFRTRHSNIYLALLLLTIGIHFSYNILYTNHLLVALSAFSCSYGFLYGPFLFLYTRFYLFQDLKFKTKDAFHFLPFALIVLLVTLGDSLCNYLGIPLILVMLTYSVLSYRLIRLYEAGVVQVYSKPVSSQTRWIKIMLMLMVIILAINIIQFGYDHFPLFGFTIRTETLVQIGILGLVNLISYQGLKSPAFFQKLSSQDRTLAKEIKTPMDDAELRVLKEYANQIDDQVSSLKLYLDADLTLRQLAEKTGIHEKSISRAINTIFQTNFSEYINGYRIDQSISLMHSEQNASIKEIMFQSGFNSRSVFNTTFKQKTGDTPSDYRKKID